MNLNSAKLSLCLLAALLMAGEARPICWGVAYDHHNGPELHLEALFN